MQIVYRATGLSGQIAPQPAHHLSKLISAWVACKARHVEKEWNAYRQSSTHIQEGSWKHGHTILLVMVALLRASLQGPTPVRRRRRPQLLPSRGNGAPCILEETVPCVFDTSIPCDSLCRHSEWTEWSSCSEKLLEFGFSPVTTSYREKLVSAEAGEACSALDLKEYDASRCNGESLLLAEAQV